MIGLELLGGLEQRSGGAARAGLLIAGEIERSAGSDPPICTAPAMVASARNTCVGSRAAIPSTSSLRKFSLSCVTVKVSEAFLIQYYIINYKLPCSLCIGGGPCGAT